MAKNDSKQVFCSYCNSKVIKKDSSIVYGKSYGDIYICSSFPKCDAYVGVDKKTGKPLGTLANKSLREARRKAHESFDQLWKTGIMSRKEAYRWLSQAMSLSKTESHIALFNIEQCNNLIEKVQQNIKGAENDT